ncbi:MAG: DUF6492 family protein [Candidatus Nanopelagicales bacterium]
MHRIALLLKSHAPDAEYARRLAASFHRFNADGLHLYLSAPAADLQAFAGLAADTVTVLPDEELAGHLVDEPVGGMRPGYINQEIVKLSFWELGLAANYFCIDSDAVFIRPFGAADLMRDEATPYTVLVEDNELKVEPRYYRQYWESRAAAVRRIATLVGLDDPVLRTCHGHQVLSATVLRSLRDGFLAPRGWTYRDALAEAPYEFSWYNLWLQASKAIPIHAREPFVKVFHHEGQHLEYILRGITIDDIARGYLALVVNSNYSRDLGLIDPDAPKPVALSHYLSYGEVGQVLSAKARDTLRRRLGR